MKTIFQVFFVLGCAAFAGGYTAWQALEQDKLSLSLTIGQWRAYLPTRSGDVPPYEKARLALYTQAQLGYGEGLRFITQTDDAGDALNSNCRYRLQGNAPKARVFTLFAADKDGQWLEVGNGVTDFVHTQSLGYDENDNISIAIGPDIPTGDWLFVPKGQNYQLVLSLYSTSIGSLSNTNETPPLPVLSRVNCDV